VSGRDAITIRAPRRPSFGHPLTEFRDAPARTQAPIGKLGAFGTPNTHRENRAGCHSQSDRTESPGSQRSLQQPLAPNQHMSPPRAAHGPRKNDVAHCHVY